MNRPTLGVNVDHVATIRQARGTRYPDPVQAAFEAELAGADQITVHLREDRRHIQDRDVALLRETVRTRLNLEMAVTPEMVAIALRVRPDLVTLVPERREERTTEGGLDVFREPEPLRRTIAELQGAGIPVSLFVDPDRRILDQSQALGAAIIELHTGDYAEAHALTDQSRELDRLRDAAVYGDELGLLVAAGHGLHENNLGPLLLIPQIVEYNIGHALVARALFTGFAEAVRDFKRLLDPPR